MADTLGHLNGVWLTLPTEDSESLSEEQRRMTDYFLANGGFASFSFDKHNVSDVTLFHLRLCESHLAFLKKSRDVGTFVIRRGGVEKVDSAIDEQLWFDAMDMAAESLVHAYAHEAVGAYGPRLPETSRSAVSIAKLSQGLPWDQLPYTQSLLEPSVITRTMFLGVLYGSSGKLARYAVDFARLTHNNARCYLGAFATALFSALAAEGKVKVFDWPHILLKRMTDVEDVVRESGRGMTEYIMERDEFVYYWRQYIGRRYSGGSLYFSPEDYLQANREKLYAEVFQARTSEPSVEMALIMAFDGLLLTLTCATLTDWHARWQHLVVTMAARPFGRIMGSLTAFWFGIIADVEVDARVEFFDELVLAAGKITQ